MKEEIKEYITTQLVNQGDMKLTDDEDLLSNGILDSIAVMKLISFIEESFEIKVTPDEMVIENFMDVNSMEKYILEKKST